METQTYAAASEAPAAERLRSLASRIFNCPCPKQLRPPVESFGREPMARIVSAAVACGLPDDRPGRYVAYWWCQAANNVAMMNDGGFQSVGQANPLAFLAWMRKHNLRHSMRLNVGSRSEAACHAILWDRRTGQVYFTGRADVEEWLTLLHYERLEAAVGV